MSQWGANGMAKKGKTYEEILKHYYTGVTIKQLEYKE
jgi:stage II sporulation protein D